MRKVIIMLMLATGCNLAFAQYKPVDKGSTLQFNIKNLGFGVSGKFSGFKGIINFDAQSPVSSSFDVTIDASTVNTDNSLRDTHLRDVSYFNVQKYPVIRFVSSKISSAGKTGIYNVSGKLTIKDVTRDIAFPFTATSSGDGYIFKGSFKINRKDFGVGGTSTISNELEVLLDVMAVKG
ncbi:MAG: YceI family protein [Mucilaginibacter sp.]